MSSNNIIKFVHANEYEKVLNENIELKYKIIQLYKSEELLKETIKMNKQLKEENISLKELIQENINTQNGKIKQLDQNILNLIDKLDKNHRLI